MDKKISYNELKIWGGIECTINRVGNEFKDQLKYSGHYKREGDLEAIAKLGIQTVRYPMLWEKHQPKQNSKIDWNWSDHQMERMQALNMTPILGLLHHGSGPSFTNLLDPQFPYLLEAYAYEVASRYPEISDYTPVNEPLTTARFSGLYGLWYPHHSNEHSFYRMLLNQLKGTVLAMEAIRSVNPSARLVQTEDLGKTHSTPLLSYQAEFENHRRLLTFDILTGRLCPGHPQYDYMLECGICKEEIDFFQQHRHPPEIMGLNYYVTSERWLDESLEKYDHHTHGGNGTHRYADTEAVRANLPVREGFRKLAAEIWERYRIPMAVTEVHLHCTREEQLRWFYEIWNDSKRLIDQGVNINGVTAWALLGSFDWDTLLTKTGTQYESGVFDIKTISGRLRPTALATLIKALANGEANFHPLLSTPGWWHHARPMIDTKSSPIVIFKGNSVTGLENTAVNQLTTLFVWACNQRNIGNILSVYPGEEFFERVNPWAVINLAGDTPGLKATCQRKNCQYVSFFRDEPAEGLLKIIIERAPVTIHQVNKILDLIIDGEQGCWIFGADQITIKRDFIFSSGMASS